jgi:hypothetical protein
MCIVPAVATRHWNGYSNINRVLFINNLLIIATLFITATVFEKRGKEDFVSSTYIYVYG